jgi:hypothetical protein
MTALPGAMADGYFWDSKSSMLHHGWGTGRQNVLGQCQPWGSPVR